jgi:signal transduction histidine kinase
MPDTSGKLRLDVQRVALATVIEEAVTSAQPAADAKGIRLVQVLGSATLIEGDPGRLQQVVWNLVSNAIKFTPKGGKVQVTLRKVDSHVEVEVSDTGAGIRADVLPHVFQRFRQADPAAPGRHGGLGLGPAIAKNLVERHGGSVTAASGGEGLGSTFIVRLPLAPSHRREPEAASAVPAQLARLLDGTTVLVPAAALTALARLEAKPVDPPELIAMVASLTGRTGRG